MVTREDMDGLSRKASGSDGPFNHPLGRTEFANGATYFRVTVGRWSVNYIIPFLASAKSLVTAIAFCGVQSPVNSWRWVNPQLRASHGFSNRQT